MSTVHLVRDGAVAELRLDNPRRLNALTGAMLDQLAAHADTIEADPAIRAVLLSAEGDRFFCAGADIREWSALSPQDFTRHWVRRGHRVFDRIAQLPMPTLAVLTGDAMGGGLELALACDLRLAAPQVRLGLPETGVGVVPGWSGTQRLAREVPSALLREMLLTGQALTAERACAAGVLNRVTDTPLVAARQLAQTIAARAPRATETAKAMLAAALGEAPAAAIEALGGAAVSGAPEMAEGVAAFTRKRPPSYED